MKSFIAKPFHHLKQSLWKFIRQVGEISVLTYHCLKCTFTGPWYVARMSEQMMILGLGSLSLAIIIGLAMGLVMTLNFGHGLAKFGGALYVPAVVGLSLLREMAPIFTSLLVAGRVASGITSEIGSMNVTQQIDALRALGTNPIRVLIVPRLVALSLSLPLLTSLSGFLGLVGGHIICSMDFNMPLGFYINKILATIKIHDYLSGIFKTVIFSFIIVIIASYAGLKTRDGTKGVGKATTWAVVVSSILIIISDFFLSKIFILVWIH
jgi:phospholipid/cholesterol/gamma-HCH transport system permease protein